MSDNIQSVHKWLHLYLVILFLLLVSRILAFNFMLMPVKIRRYRAIIIIISKIQYLGSVWLSDYFLVEMSQVIETTINVGSHMENDDL